jgi:hypothetical protein
MGGVEGIGRRWPNLAASVEALQGSLRSVLPGGSWEPMGRLPSPGALCFESPQVACYEKGQQFMAHEDAFPAAVCSSPKTDKIYTETYVSKSGVH